MTQADDILWMLRRNGDDGVTAIDALNEAGCFRLAARIADLRAAGHDISSTIEPVGLTGKRVARYRLREHWITTGEQTALPL